MRYIDTLYPSTMTHSEKYWRNMLARKNIERFLTESRNVCYSAWNIHRKLYEERFGKVYYYIPRGISNLRDLEEYFELLESARDVEVR